MAATRTHQGVRPQMALSVNLSPSGARLEAKERATCMRGRRRKEELEPYFEILNELFEDLLIDDVVDNFKIEFIGSTDLLPEFLQTTIEQLEEVRGGGQKTLTIALGYGGRQEILDAIKGLIDENRNQENDFDRLIENVTDEQLRQHLYSPEAPDIDLIIRTSGESRLSGFLLWQSAYSEVIFQDVYWPEFRKIDFLRCLREYAQRERRFGQ